MHREEHFSGKGPGTNTVKTDSYPAVVWAYDATLTEPSAVAPCWAYVWKRRVTGESDLGATALGFVSGDLI